MSSNSSGENLMQNDEMMEKSFYKKVLYDFKQQYFSVLFALVKDQTTPSLLFFLLIILLNFTQLLYFPFHHEV